MQKCQKCHNPATLHITEVLGEEQFEELHLCEECANKYLYEPQQKAGAAREASSQGATRARRGCSISSECPLCGIKFVEFRNTGRLGCPHDYQEFREELLPLLENIHGETRHCGKTPRRLPQNKQTQSELIQLRKHLKQAVTKEAYEEAARLRDRIRSSKKVEGRSAVGPTHGIAEVRGTQGEGGSRREVPVLLQPGDRPPDRHRQRAQKKKLHLCQACAEKQQLLKQQELNLPAILQTLIGQHVGPDATSWRD